MLRERKRSLGFLIAPLIVLFLASLLNHYPLYGRLLLFACPILLLVVSEGAVWAYNTSRRLSPILGIVFLALLLAKPMYRAAAGLIQPTRPDDIKGAIQYIQTRRRPADVWYVYYGAIYQPCAGKNWNRTHRRAINATEKTARRVHDSAHGLSQTPAEYRSWTSLQLSLWQLRSLPAVRKNIITETVKITRNFVL